jgi:hypothetical protein
LAFPQELEQQLSQARAALAAEAGRLERHFLTAQEQERRTCADAAERLQQARIAPLATHMGVPCRWFDVGSWGMPVPARPHRAPRQLQTGPARPPVGHSGL